MPDSVRLPWFSQPVPRTPQQSPRPSASPTQSATSRANRAKRLVYEGVGYAKEGFSSHPQGHRIGPVGAVGFAIGAGLLSITVKKILEGGGKILVNKHTTKAAKKGLNKTKAQFRKAWDWAYDMGFTTKGKGKAQWNKWFDSDPVKKAAKAEKKQAKLDAKEAKKAEKAALKAEKKAEQAKNVNVTA